MFVRVVSGPECDVDHTRLSCALQTSLANGNGKRDSRQGLGIGSVRQAGKNVGSRAAAARPKHQAYQVAIPPERGCWATIIAGRLVCGLAATFFIGCRAGYIFGSGTTTVAMSVIFVSKASCS